MTILLLPNLHHSCNIGLRSANVTPLGLRELFFEYCTRSFFALNVSNDCAFFFPNRSCCSPTHGARGWFAQHSRIASDLAIFSLKLVFRERFSLHHERFLLIFLFSVYCLSPTSNAAIWLSSTGKAKKEKGFILGMWGRNTRLLTS